jgi:hypothetical protein
MTLELKLAIKRFARVFLSSFIFTALGFVEMFGGWSIIINSFKSSVKDGFMTLLATLLMPMIIASCSAGLNAVGKVLRSEKITYRNKIEELISKLF